MKRVGWGILGSGWIGTESIAPAIGWSRNGRLVAVASRDPAVAAAKAKETGAERAYSPYEALLEDAEVDAVYIGLPNGLHEEWAIRCAEAGKHVLCEKSLALTFDAALRMTRAFRDRHLRLVEAFMYRHHPQWIVVRDLIDGGAVGRVRVVRGSFCGRLDKPNDHRWSASLGGGALWDLTCYSVDAARYVTRAEPLRATAVADLRSPEAVDGTSQASLVFGGDVIVSATGSLQAGFDQELVVVGDEGVVRVARPYAPGWNAAHVTLARRGEAERLFEVGGANHFLHQVEHFASLVLDPGRDPWPAEDGLLNVAACEAIAGSWRSGAATPVRSVVLSAPSASAGRQP
jgi:predicted dehydrogenase